MIVAGQREIVAARVTEWRPTDQDKRSVRGIVPAGPREAREFRQVDCESSGLRAVGKRVRTLAPRPLCNKWLWSGFHCRHRMCHSRQVTT